MKRIAILGPGLIGGSLALKLRAPGRWQVALWARRAEAVEAILARGIADAASTDAREAVHDADVVVFSTPVGAMRGLAEEIADAVKPGALVTDVGSVKASVVAGLAPVFRGRARFIGSHPMAGSQFTGLDAADAGLFEGTTCIITPDSATEHTAIEEATEFWKQTGSRVLRLPPATHDECVALISHLPHLVAGVLVRTAAAVNPRAFDVVGPGFRDSTRVASGPPEMWTGILSENAPAVTAALDALIAKLGELRQMLAAPDVDGRALQQLLADAKETRDRIQFPK